MLLHFPHLNNKINLQQIEQNKAVKSDKVTNTKKKKGYTNHFDTNKKTKVTKHVKYKKNTFKNTIMSIREKKTHIHTNSVNATN